MAKKFKIILLSLCLATVLLLPTLTLAATDIKSMLNDAAGQEGAGFNVPAGQEDAYLAVVAGFIASIFLSLLGVVFISYTIYGGYLWMTAAGNEEKIKKAKDTIKSGVIGLIIVLGAAAIYMTVRNILVGPLSGSGM